SPSFSGRIVPLFDTMLIQQGEDSGTPIKPHHTPSPEATSSHHTTSSIPLPSFPTAPIPIPTVTQTNTTLIIQYSRRARIAQSSALPTVADEPASPVRDDSQGEACPTDSGFIADQDRATIAKSSTLPRDSAPRVTSPAAEEGSIQHTLNELTAFYTSLQRQHSELLAKFQAQGVEINRLKERIKNMEDKEGVIGDKSGDDAPIKGRSSNEGEAAAEGVSNDSEEIARVLTSLDAVNVLAGETNVPTGSGSIPTAGPPATIVTTGSEVGHPGYRNGRAGRSDGFIWCPINYREVSDKGTAAPEMPPPEDVPATAAPGADQAREAVAAEPPAARESRVPADVSDPDPLAFADAPSPHPAEVAQSSQGIAAAGDPESENVSSSAEVGSPGSYYLTITGLWGREAVGCFRGVQEAAERAGGAA
nr:hypothetical protein [Tanacetum cinerariifolium]